MITVSEMQKIITDSSYKSSKAQEGTVLTVMHEGPSQSNPSMMTGRTEGNKIVLYSHQNCMPGDILKVRIDTAKTWYLEGTVITED